MAYAEIFCPPLFARFGRAAGLARLWDYRDDTLSGLERMRNAETGLVRDTIFLRSLRRGATEIKVRNNNTSAINIGLDVINQLGELDRPELAEGAMKRIEAVVSSLEKMDRHADTGLFFSWYSTDKDLRVMSRDVSSVDNIHLALALWSTAEKLPKTEIGRRAARLFETFDFSKFYDPKTGLMAGNFKFADGKWELEKYQFANAGSEARSIYSLTWALGLLRTTPDREFPVKAIESLTAEMFTWKDGDKTGRILKTWDGGAFQLLLPKLLLNEEKYSPELAKSFSSYGRYIISEGQRQGFQVPAAHSASSYGIDAYVGKAGSPALVSTGHIDVHETKNRKNWDIVFTPHAAIMAATMNPSEMAPLLAAAEGLRSGPNLMYRSGFGFMDGYHVKGIYKGQVVPIQLSLDQGMISLALGQMNAADGLSPSGRLLMNNDRVRSRLEEFYRLFDKKLSETK